MPKGELFFNLFFYFLFSKGVLTNDEDSENKTRSLQLNKVKKMYNLNESTDRYTSKNTFCENGLQNTSILFQFICEKISWKLSKISHFSILQWINEPTDRHTSKKWHFVLTNLWDSSRGRCPPILEKISWKQSKISHFSIFQWTNEPTDRHLSKKKHLVLANLWERSTKYFNFISTDLWEMSVRRCSQIF